MPVSDLPLELGQSKRIGRHMEEVPGESEHPELHFLPFRSCSALVV
jgi:hypothetical protein